VTSFPEFGRISGFGRSDMLRLRQNTVGILMILVSRNPLTLSFGSRLCLMSPHGNRDGVPVVRAGILSVPRWRWRELGETIDIHGGDATWSFPTMNVRQPSPNR